MRRTRWPFVSAACASPPACRREPRAPDLHAPESDALDLLHALDRLHALTC